MPSLGKLISVLEDVRRLLSLPDNDFAWSSWNDCNDAVGEIDTNLSALRAGVQPEKLTLQVLFAPTGPIQEVSLSSGWGNEFIELANRFDSALSSNDRL
jgi:hypothetical protein